MPRFLRFLFRNVQVEFSGYRRSCDRSELIVRQCPISHFYRQESTKRASSTRSVQAENSAITGDFRTSTEEKNSGNPMPPTDIAIAIDKSPGSSDFRMLLSSSIKYGLTTGSYNQSKVLL